MIDIEYLFELLKLNEHFIYFKMRWCVAKTSSVYFLRSSSEVIFMDVLRWNLLRVFIRNWFLLSMIFLENIKKIEIHGFCYFETFSTEFFYRFVVAGLWCYPWLIILVKGLKLLPLLFLSFSPECEFCTGKCLFLVYLCLSWLVDPLDYLLCLRPKPFLLLTKP